jgi:hypothetical protein
MSHAEYLNQISPPLCQRLRECNPEKFPESFPDGGVTECADIVKGASQRPTEPIKCTSAEVDQCVTDIKQLACGDLGFSPFNLPPTCTRCV